MSVKRLWKSIRFSQSTPFYLYMGNTKNNAEMIQLHKLISKNAYPNYPRTLAFVLKLAILLFWPIRLIEISVKLSSKAGRLVAERTGKSQIQQINELLIYSLRYSLPPRAYYNYDLYQPDRKHLIASFIYDHEISSLFNMLNSKQVHSEVDDKTAFYRLCMRAGLSTAPVLIEIKDGELETLSQKQRALPKKDIFVKPACGSKGQGCDSWLYNNGSYLSAHKHISLPGSELLAQLKSSSYHKRLIIQALLKSHPKLADISLGSLCCVRLISCYQNNEVSYLSAVLKIPFGSQTTNTNGLISPINNASGELSRAYKYKLLCNGYDQHPDSHAVITGRIVPDWDKVIELALEAHSHFSGYMFLGWDIALTDSGPVLLETNADWDVKTMQRGKQKPLGETRFIEHISLRLK